MLLLGAFHCLRRDCFGAARSVSEPDDLEVVRVVGRGNAGDAGVMREDFELEGFIAPDEEGDDFFAFDALAPDTCRLKFCSLLSWINSRLVLDLRSTSFLSLGWKRRIDRKITYKEGD
jgi:hypothetical protein